MWYVPPGPAAGGKAGKPGGGARILRITLNGVIGGQTILNVIIGTGGTGGLFSDGENSPGQNGGDTIVDGYTTEGSRETATGYYDPINGVLYGAPGKDGIPGGAGGGYDPSAEAETIQAESVTGFGQTFTGGVSIGMTQKIERGGGVDNEDYGRVEGTAWGGYGGGAAYGSDGGNSAIESAYVFANYNSAVARGAAGGFGATALPPPTPSTYGTGGFGGNGGGGAGSCGASQVENKYYKNSASPAPSFLAGAGTMRPGNGSDGGRGADGVLLIYY